MTPLRLSHVHEKWTIIRNSITIFQRQVKTHLNYWHEYFMTENFAISISLIIHIYLLSVSFIRFTLYLFAQNANKRFRLQILITKFNVILVLFYGWSTIDLLYICISYWKFFFIFFFVQSLESVRRIWHCMSSIHQTVCVYIHENLLQWREKLRYHIEFRVLLSNAAR